MAVLEESKLFSKDEIKRIMEKSVSEEVKNNLKKLTGTHYTSKLFICLLLTNLQRKQLSVEFTVPLQCTLLAHIYGRVSNCTIGFSTRTARN